MATLFKRKSIWYINYCLNGKQHRKSTKTEDKKLAKIALDDLNLKLFKNEIQEKPVHKIVYIRSLFLQYVKFISGNVSQAHFRNVKARLFAWQQYFFENHISKLDQISTEPVYDFTTSRLSGRSQKTKKHYLTALKACLNYAVECGIIVNNPIARVKSPKLITSYHYFEKEEIRELVTGASDKLKLAIIILVNTGIRRGELWGLRWRDVDSENRMLYIRSHEEFTTKSGIDRSVPINSECDDALKMLKKASKKTDIYVYRLFPSVWSLSRAFIIHRNKLGIKGRLHDLRHTFASHLIMSGSPLPVVKDLLGHSNISTTMIYAHLTPGIHNREVEKLSFLAHN